MVGSMQTPVMLGKQIVGERRQMNDITDRISSDSGASLIQAIAEQNLEKYGYTIGDYFESPTARTLKQQDNNTSTETNVSVKLKYYLADMDTYYGGYDAYAVISTHHIAIVVDTGVTRQWNNTADVSNIGYNGSTLQAFLEGTGSGQVMAAINTDIIALFGSNRLISHSKLFSTKSESWTWTDPKYISAPTESEIYGHRMESMNQYQEGEAIKPLKLFQKYKWTQVIGHNDSTWLRDMYTDTNACRAAGGGIGANGQVTATNYVIGVVLLH